MTDKVTTNTKEKNVVLSKLLYTIRETAELLSISEKSVRRLIERNLLKKNPALRHILVTRDSIEAFAKLTTS